VSQHLPFIGASIDGSIEYPKCGKGIVELKCCCIFQDGKLKLKKSARWAYVSREEGRDLAIYSVLNRRICTFVFKVSR